MSNKFEKVEDFEFDIPTDFENEYCDLLISIQESGDYKENRTGINTTSWFGGNILYHRSQEEPVLSSHVIRKVIGEPDDEIHAVCMATPLPILTLRPIKFDVAWYETLMFLRGITDTKWLENKGISIWKGNTSREFLDQQNLNYLPEGNMGKGYGYQWRSFNDQTDQIICVLNQMKRNPFSRRHIVTAWNPEQLDEMALDPCHLLYQFNVVEQAGQYHVDLQFYMRSSDLVFGLPFNMLSYSIILNLICIYLTETTDRNWVPRNVIYVSGDAHIYDNQIDYMNEYLERDEAQPLIRYGSYSNRCVPYLILPQPNLGSKDLTFDEFLIWVEEQGYSLLYTPPPALETPRPKMAV